MYFILSRKIELETVVIVTSPLIDFFFQVICHHSACLVLFHQKYGYGKPEKEFEKLGQLAATNSEVLIAEIGTTGMCQGHLLMIGISSFHILEFLPRAFGAGDQWISVLKDGMYVYFMTFFTI